MAQRRKTFMTVIQFPPQQPAPDNENTPPDGLHGPVHAPPHEPILNLPPITAGLIATLVAIHGLLALGDTFIDSRVMLAAVSQFGFVPASLVDTVRGALPFSIIPFITLLTAGLIHGSWLHLGVNATMLLAAGGGVERVLGKIWLLGLLLGGIVVGNLTYLALNPDGVMPLIGASGGISALFGSCMLLLGGAGRKQILSWLGIFIGLSLLQAWMGGPNGESIAGSAHIGGFVFGLGVTVWLKEHRLKNGI